MLTRELNKIMSVIIPVTREELGPGQSGHAHLPGMHQPIRERESELLQYMTSPSAASLSILPPHQRQTCRRSLVQHSPLLPPPVLFVHGAAFFVSSDQEVFIRVTNKGETGQKIKQKGDQEGEKRREKSNSFHCLHSAGSAQMPQFKLSAKMKKR